MLARKKSQHDLLTFTRELAIEPEPAHHHRVLIEKLQQVIDGKLTRLMVFMPPGSAKSTYCSVLLPAAYLGVHDTRRIIAGSYDTGLSTLFGRRVRNLVNGPDYRRIFPIEVAGDTRAKGEWDVSTGGGYYATGVGSAVTGRRGHLGILDDLIKGRKDADSQTVRDSTWEWYKSDFRTRLIPDNNAIVFIMCMTGDTPVLMANGQEKHLRDIRVGDQVATYNDGRITHSRISNWINQGPDSVLRIRMNSGIIVKANKRHPFLVDRDGESEWVRLQNLKIGDNILRVIGESGEGFSVSKTGARKRQSAKGYVRRITTGLVGQKVSGRLHAILNQEEAHGCAIDTGLMAQITTKCLWIKAVFVRYVTAPLEIIRGLTGGVSYALITATTPTRFAASCATTAILQSSMEKRKKPCLQRLDTYEVIPDCVVSIEECGIEDVFDIQVEGTENFIANGLVSHNTRWHEDDPAGRILPEGWNGESGLIEARDGEIWDVLSIPAEAMQGDAIGRKPGDWLWPEWFSPKFWKQEKISQGPRNWSALYQQQPSPDEGIYFKREWFFRYDPQKIPNVRKYMSADFAVTEEAEADDPDYTEIGVHGAMKAYSDDIEFTKLYLCIDGWSGRTEPLKWVNEYFNLNLRHRPDCEFAEVGVIRRAVEGILRRQRLERRATGLIEWMPHIGDKSANARALQSMAAQGLVGLPNNEYGDYCLDQLVRFPTGKYDDAVDMMAIMARAVDEAHPMIDIPKALDEKKDRYDRVFDQVEEDWKTA